MAGLDIHEEVEVHPDIEAIFGEHRATGLKLASHCDVGELEALGMHYTGFDDWPATAPPDALMKARRREQEQLMRDRPGEEGDLLDEPLYRFVAVG